jgi:hypothetical protein
LAAAVEIPAAPASFGSTPASADCTPPACVRAAVSALSVSA